MAFPHFQCSDLLTDLTQDVHTQRHLELNVIIISATFKQYCFIHRQFPKCMHPSIFSPQEAQWKLPSLHPRPCSCGEKKYLLCLSQLLYPKPQEKHQAHSQASLALWLCRSVSDMTYVLIYFMIFEKVTHTTIVHSIFVLLFFSIALPSMVFLG